MTGQSFYQLYVRPSKSSGYDIYFGKEQKHVGERYIDALLKCKTNREIIHLLLQLVPIKTIKEHYRFLWDSYHAKVMQKFLSKNRSNKNDKNKHTGRTVLRRERSRS